MVTGIKSFQEWFFEYEEQYAIIGGTACDLLMTEEGLDFRATKDIDLVLLIESITPEFVSRFWEYIVNAGYKHCNKSTGAPQFYRFTDPKNSNYPFMIELFSRRIDAIMLPAEAVLTPLPLDDSLSSLSAILLDDAYYELIQSGRTKLHGVTVLDAAFLILFKAKAWCDLSERKANGEKIDSKNIRKHKNDVFRLSALLGPNTKITVSSSVYQDMQAFVKAMELEDVDLRQLGITRKKDAILAAFESTYILG